MASLQMAADSNTRARWDALRTLLAARYANAAEAYVAMGGRAGGEISLQQLERSLQDLNVRVMGLRRGVSAGRSVDVHAILADVEGAYHSGINFQQFASALAWEDKAPQVLRSKEMIASRVLVGAPGSALRASRENEPPAAPRAAGSADRFAKRPSSPARSPATRSPGTGDDSRDPRSMAFPNWQGKKWSSSKAPPAHFMQQQRRETALHAAVSQDKHVKLLKNPGLQPRMDAIEAAEAKLAKLVQIDDAYKAKQPQEPIQPLIQRPKDPSASPAHVYEGSPLPTATPAPARSPASPNRPRSPAGVPGGNGGMSSKAAELSERLAALNSSVFQQKLSLAETEKNILLKERQELQAQIRQMNHLQKQSQVEMQNKMTDQFGKAMKETFEQIKDVMKSMQGAEKKDLVSLNDAFEKKIRKELLHMAAEGENPTTTLVEKRNELYGPLSTELHNYFDSVMSVRAETEGERVGNGFFFHLYDQIDKYRPEMKQSKDHVDAANPHSTKSPFLLAIINSVQYNPVLSWYTVDSQDLPNAGSVGKLARLDPLNEQDYVDDFLLEMLIAIRLNQIFPEGADPQSGQSILGTIMPIFFGGENPGKFSRSFALFPREKLHLLSSKPSIETAKVAAALLHSVGVSTPEHFLRLSIREVVGKILDFPGVWMDRYESKNEAQAEAAKMIIGLSRAENSALVAKVVESRGLGDRGAQAQVLETSVAEDEPVDFEGEESEDEDDISRHQKQTQREQMKAMREERNKRALQRRLEEHEGRVEVESKKKDCLAHFERCFRELGFDSQCKNLAQQALKNRGIILQEILAVQESAQRDEGDEAIMRKAMRRFARTEGLLKRQSFEGWVQWVSTVKNFMSKVGWRSNLKRIYFDHWRNFFREFQLSTGLCERMNVKKKAALLQEVWMAWREQYEEETEKKDEEAVDTTDPAHLASLLRKLEAAVVETHQKHSSLLEMRHDEEVMSTLLQKLSPEACDKLQDAGITKIEHLVHCTMGAEKADSVKTFDDTKLKGYGIEDRHDLQRIEMFLVNPESFNLGGLVPPQGDFDQKREHLLEDMSNLRQKLNLKKEKLMEEFPDERAQSQLSKEAEKPKDPNLGVLNELLGALGVTPVQQPEEPEAPADPEDAADVADPDFPGFEEQVKRDKEKVQYINKLKREGNAAQSVLQALTLSLGDVEENADDKEVVDQDTDNAKKAFSEKLVSMEKTMDMFVNAMARARELLDNDDHGQEGEPVSATEPSNEPYDRAEELSLGSHTSGELQAQQLAADVERRNQQADALERENMELKSQLESMRIMQNRPRVVSKSSKPAHGSHGTPKQHWWAKIADPELAQKYGQLSGDEEESGAIDASFVDDPLDDDEADRYRFLDPAFVDGLLPKDGLQTNFGWSLNTVDDTTPLTRSSLFDNLLEDRIQRGRQALKARMDTTTVELEEVQKDISNAREVDAELKAKYEELQKKGAKSYRPNPKQLQEQILKNDSERREAEDRLKALEVREDALKSLLAQLKSQHEALDLRKELEDMDRKMNDEKAAAMEELDGLIDAEELDPTPEIAERIAEAREKVARIEASWKLKRNLRVKEIEIEIMGQKMAEDEAMLRDDVAKCKGVSTNRANDARDELSKALQTMEDSVTQTARGRCRPEVLASMPAVQKLRGAVNRHKLALETAKMAEQNRLLEEETAEKAKREAEERKRIEEEEMKKMRATADLDHREKRRQDLAEALMKKKMEMFTDANNYLEDCKEAVKQGDSDFCKMIIPKVDGTRRHAKSFLADAKALYDELQGTDQSPPIVTDRRELQELEKSVKDHEEQLISNTEGLKIQQQAVERGEKELIDDAKSALSKVDKLLKKDLRKTDTLSQEAADVRQHMANLLPKLDELNLVEDLARVKSREFAGTEEKLRHAWARLAPKIDDALYTELAAGDKSLDLVQSALASGKLSTAHKELLKAQDAFQKVTTAKK